VSHLDKQYQIHINHFKLKLKSRYSCDVWCRNGIRNMREYSKRNYQIEAPQPKLHSEHDHINHYTIFKQH